MNCSDAQDRLSAYHDGELSPVLSAEISSHLAECSSCAADIALFNKLTGMSRRLVDPSAPTHIWDDLEMKLRGERKGSTYHATFVRKRTPGRLWAVAATILIAVGIGVGAYQAWFAESDHDHLAGNFAAYLNEFNERPDEAQRILLVNYEGQPTTLQDATAALGYEPVAAKGLPPGCTSVSTHLLKMPCCICTQVMCRNKDGKAIAIFEHDSDQPAWFGSRPTIKCHCHEMPTSVVELGNKLAATWKNGKRYITIIGATDLAEVAEFVGYFSGPKAGSG